MSDAGFIFRSMNTHQVLIILVVDTRVLSCVANSLQKRRFASISSTYYKDTKSSIFLSEVIGITVAHGRCGCKELCKERPRGTPQATRFAFRRQWPNTESVLFKFVPLVSVAWRVSYRSRPRGKYQVCRRRLDGLLPNSRWIVL
jgi:hypothetical protein